MEARERTVVYYMPEPAGTPAPFGAWRDGCRDPVVKAALDARVARLRGGNFSDSRPVGGGVHESRINLGPGYRIYYGNDGATIILLLAGEKSTQHSDIIRAGRYWENYKERKKQNAKKSELQKRPARRPSR